MVRKAVNGLPAHMTCQRWFPRADLDAESFAFGILFGNSPDDQVPRKIGADAWFDRRDADQFEIQEQTVRVANDEILTLLLINEPRMLEDWGAGVPTRGGGDSET